MSLSYKINDNFVNTISSSCEEKQKKNSLKSKIHEKKATIHEYPPKVPLTLSKLSKNMLFYNRNNSINNQSLSLKTMNQTNKSNLYKPPAKSPLKLIHIRNNSSNSKINNPSKIDSYRKNLTYSPLSPMKRHSEDVSKTRTLEDEPIENMKDMPLNQILEENNMTEVIMTEYSDTMVQKLPCTKLFNNPKFTKKTSSDSNEYSTRTSSAFFGGKISQNCEFNYEKTVTKDLNLLLITNKDTGEKQDINKLNQKIVKQKYLEKLTTTKNIWEDWWQEKKDNKMQVFSSVKNNNIKGLMRLIEITGDLKPDINIKDEKGWTPLHYSCLIGNFQIASFLINQGADVDLLNNLKQSPLIVATQKGFENLVYLLIGRGCNVNVQDLSNNTALHYACIYSYVHIIKTLLSVRTINIFIKNIENKTALQATPNNFEIILLFDEFIMIKKQEESLKNDPTPENRNHDNKDKENKSNKNIIGPNSFSVISLLGKGSFAEVYLVEKKDEKKLYAMKVLHKNKILRNFLSKYVLTERNILCSLSHPFIVKLNYAFQTNEEMFLVLDYCSGGDLGKYLLKEKRFSEDKAKFYVSEILLALEYLHQNNIIYRDLKPDNVIIDTEGHTLLTDFGLSKEGIFDGTSTNSFCGSIAYLAPEILQKTGHGKSVDWYLLGVLLYEMLVGVTPYYSIKKEEIFSKIENCEEVNLPNFLSLEAKDLIKKLMEKNPKNRLGFTGAEAIKSHCFFKNIDWDHVLQRKLIPPYPYLNSKKNLKPCFVKFDEKKLYDNNLKGWSFLKNNQN